MPVKIMQRGYKCYTRSVENGRLAPWCISDRWYVSKTDNGHLVTAVKEQTGQPLLVFEVAEVMPAFPENSVLRLNGLFWILRGRCWYHGSDTLPLDAYTQGILMPYTVTLGPRLLNGPLQVNELFYSENAVCVANKIVHGASAGTLIQCQTFVGTSRQVRERRNSSKECVCTTWYKRAHNFVFTCENDTYTLVEFEGTRPENYQPNMFQAVFSDLPTLR